MERRRFKTELADVEITADLQITVDGFLKFADFFFDGLFTDLSLIHISDPAGNGKLLQISRSYVSRLETHALEQLRKGWLQESPGE